MAVISNHLNSRMRFTDAEGKTFNSLNQIRPNINAVEANFIRQGFGQIRGVPVAGTFLSITTELSETD